MLSVVAVYAMMRHRIIDVDYTPWCISAGVVDLQILYFIDKFLLA